VLSLIRVRGEPVPEQVEEEVRAFLLTVVMGEAGSRLPDDVPLLSGILDSLSLMQLLDFLEHRYSITVDPEDLVDENFGSVASVAAFVEAKRQDSS
jgi:acyl carrier protein